MSHRLLAEVLEETGRHAEGEQAARRAIVLGEKLATDWPDVARLPVCSVGDATSALGLSHGCRRDGLQSRAGLPPGHRTV